MSHVHGRKMFNKQSLKIAQKQLRCNNSRNKLSPHLLFEIKTLEINYKESMYKYNGL
jgi:hypothetical protein